MLLWKIIIGIISFTVAIIGGKIVDDNTPMVLYYWDVGEQKYPTKSEKRKIRIGKIMVIIGLIGAFIQFFL